MIKIHSALDGFVLVDAITAIGDTKIHGIRAFSHAPLYLGLESLAQIGAYHVRFLTHFERHAFLLKITRCFMPREEVLDGRYLLSGTLLNRSAFAFSYALQAETGGKGPIRGEFLFATVAYDQAFKKTPLKEHYRKIFSCLRHESKTG